LWEWGAIALCFVLAGTAQAADILTKAQFRQQVAARIVADHPTAKITMVGADSIRVELPGVEAMTTTLERAYGIYKGQPEVLPDILKGLSGSVRAHRPKATLDTLIVLVRPDTFVTGRGVLARPLAGGMSAIVALDEPDNFEFPTRGGLRAELALEDKAIWRRALENTRAKTRITPRPIDPQRMVHIGTGGYFASSLLADDEFWDSKEMRSAGPLAVFAFARDDIYFAPLSNTPAVEELRKMATQLRNDPNGLTNDVIVRREGHWETLR
jgi:hypothetical protein